MKKRIAVLIVHGFAGGTYDQEELANTLELIDKFDVFSFTLPGHDKYVVKNINKDDWINAASANVERLIKNGYKEIYVVGHSMGGVITCLLATKYKEIKKIVLAAPAFEVMSSKNGKINILGSMKQVPRVIKRFDGFKELVSRVIKFPVRVVKELQKLVCANQDLPSKIDIPTLIIHGTADDMVPYTSSLNVFSKINTEEKNLVIIDGLTHNVFKDKKRKEIINMVQEFLVCKKKVKKEIKKIK